VWPEKWASVDPTTKTPVFLFSVDGTHCCCGDPGDPKYYSHKFHGAAFNYELALSIHEDALVWINGPTKASEGPDIAVLRQGGLLEKIPAGKRGIGDNGYRGEKHFISTPNPYDDDETIHPKKLKNHRGELRWEGSMAQQLLRLDMDDGKHQIMKPENLYNSRFEYLEQCSLGTFREHIYQEMRRRRKVRFAKNKAMKK
jgi:hypothetical protein